MFTLAQHVALRLGIGLLVGGWFLWWSAKQHPQSPFRRWLDVYLAILLTGIIGARVAHILLNLDYFLDNPALMPRLWYGGLHWSGALLGGGLAVFLMGRWRGVRLPDFLDGLALALPLIFMAGWWGCRKAGCGVGQAVAHPDDYPVWMVGYLRDSSGFVYPHSELQMLGIGSGLMVLIIVGWLTLQERLIGLRLWLALFCLSLAMLLLESLRDAPLTFNQLAAGVTGLLSLSILIGSAKRRTNVYARGERDQL